MDEKQFGTIHVNRGANPNETCENCIWSKRTEPFVHDSSFTQCTYRKRYEVGYDVPLDGWCAHYKRDPNK